MKASLMEPPQKATHDSTLTPKGKSSLVRSLIVAPSIQRSLAHRGEKELRVEE